MSFQTHRTNVVYVDFEGAAFEHQILVKPTMRLNVKYGHI